MVKEITMIRSHRNSTFPRLLADNLREHSNDQQYGKLVVICDIMIVIR